VRGVRRWVHETAGGLPRGFWFLWTNTLINRLGSFVLILLALYLTQVRGFTPAFAGLVIGLWGAGGAVGTLIGGVLADRWGRKPTFVTALYVSAALMLTLGIVRGAPETAITVLALGMASEASRPAMTALMVDMVPPSDRLRAFSLNYWVINLGFAFAAITAGFVANVNFLLLFVIDAGTTIAAATVVAIAIKEPAVRRAAGFTAAKSTVEREAGLRTVFRDRVFIAFVGVNLLTALVFAQHISTLPIAMGRDGLAASTYGTVIALNGLLIVAGQLFMARVLRRFRHSTALAIAAMVMGVGFGLTAFAHAPWFYAVTVLVWTVGEMFNAPSNSTMNADLAPVALRGRYQGVFNLSWSAAGFLAPIVGAAAFQYLGNTALWLGCFALAAIAAVLHLIAGPSRERRIAALRAEEAPRFAAPDKELVSL
jgi:MFS family permease